MQVVGFSCSKRVPLLPRGARRRAALPRRGSEVHRVKGVDRATFLPLTRLPLGVTSMAIDVGGFTPRDVVGDALPLRSRAVGK